jgi:O-antigen ligase
MDGDRKMPMAMFDRVFDRALLARAADGLAIAVAVSLPWSTSATGILTVLWLLAVLPTLDREERRRTLTLPAAVLSVALVALALLGVLWSEAPLGERFGGFQVFLRLLVIPLLFVEFRRSDRGIGVIVGFFVSCTALLLLSWTLKLFPSLPWRGSGFGVPVKDYVVQSGEFLICAFGLAHVALTLWQERRRALAMGLIVLALLFMANIAFVATGRTSLVVFVVLLVVFGAQRGGWRGAVGVLVVGAALAAATWTFSPYLRTRVLGVVDEIRRYETQDAETSSGYRLEFWKKSIGFIETSPVFGHGTGSTEEMFRRASVGATGMSAVVTSNPHNQYLLIAIELGLAGVALLIAMWSAHGLLFRAASWPAWLGLGVVIQNVVASLFNAQLFYFTPGWTYVFGVGVLGGMALAARDRAAPEG